MEPNQETTGDVFFLPSDFPGAASFKGGETITLKVVKASPDGVEVSLVSGMKPESEKDWDEDLRTSLAPEEGEESEY